MDNLNQINCFRCYIGDENQYCFPSCENTDGLVYTSLPPMIFCKKSHEYYFIGDVCHCQNEEKDI